VLLLFCIDSNSTRIATFLLHFFYIIGFVIGVGHGLVMAPLTIVAADATAANAVIMATAAKSFAKFCGFINTPPTLF